MRLPWSNWSSKETSGLFNCFELQKCNLELHSAPSVWLEVIFKFYLFRCTLSLCLLWSKSHCKLSHGPSKVWDFEPEIISWVVFFFFYEGTRKQWYEDKICKWLYGLFSVILLPSVPHWSVILWYQHLGQLTCIFCFLVDWRKLMLHVFLWKDKHV